MRNKENKEKKEIRIFESARKAWEAMQEFRDDRERNKRYTYGRQWSDPITVDGRTVTEEQYIREQGNLPLKNNLIRRLVRNVLGVFRNNWVQPRSVARDSSEQAMAEVLNVLLEYNHGINRMQEIYARTLEEFLISGLAVHRKWYGERRGRLECWTDYVSPNNFFVDAAMGDFRGWDVSCIGELHDMKFEDLCGYLAENDGDIGFLRKKYGVEEIAESTPFGRKPDRNGFHAPSAPGLCRVIEVWNREQKRMLRCYDRGSGRVCHCEMKLLSRLQEQNSVRKSIGEEEIQISVTCAEVWRSYFFSPDGTLLKSQESPYPGHEHPYVFKAYPFIDGEIHSFVADIIDQQRYTNRLITLYDWVMRASAKGVLLFPEGALPEGYDIEDIADRWSRFNGVIEYRPRSGMPLPQQVSSNATNIGITELLQIQLKMLEDVSGVNGALQGKLESGSMSGTLYEQQTRNSLTSLQDLLASYHSFVMDCTSKDAANIHHFYPMSKVESIAGAGSGVFCEYRRVGYGDPCLDFAFE